MFSREELKQMAEMSNDKHLYVTLYLNVNPITNPKGEYVTHLKNLIKEAEKQTPRENFKAVREDIQKIESFVMTNRREFRKALVIVSSTAAGLWRVFHLAVPVKNLLVIDKTPCIEPLLDLLDNHPRYLILIIEKEHARIFGVHLSEVYEYVKIHTPDVPGKHKKGGWFALAETNYQRHIDYHVGIHLKEVEKALEEILQKEKINIIFVGGHEEARKRFIQMLPQAIREKVFGEFNAELQWNSDEILKKVQPLLKEYEKNKERTLLEELITKTLKGDAAVLGIEDTVNALWEGKVHILVLDRDYTQKGYRCTGCGFLTPNNMPRCPYCNSSLEEVEHLSDYLAQKALEQGARVEVIMHERQLLQEKGSIGAILRY